MTLTLATAASDVARSAHYIVPTGGTVPIQTLLLEPQRTNLCIRSEEFDTWTDINTCNVTANAIAAPDGTMTADLLIATGTGSERRRTVTFTGDGEKAFAVYLKAGTSTRTRIGLRDTTATVNRHNVRVTWTAGVPTLVSADGAGTLYPVEALRDGWYRILISATGIVALNTNIVNVAPDDLVGTGSVYAWGAQAENAVVPSSYIPTAATAVTRSADSLFFPFTAPPQAMTVYVRGVNRGTTAISSARILQISTGSTSAAPRFGINQASNRLQVFSENTVLRTSSPVATYAVGDLVDFRGVLRSDGSVVGGVSINGAAEVVGPASSADFPLPSAWAGTRLYLNSGGNSDGGQFAYTHVVVAQGEQSLATMRQLAGVV
jgi:hypothetical protein